MKEACTKAYAYCRYSSHNQDDGWSIESQKSALSKYAKTNQIQIMDFFIDEAKTGRNANRPGYQKMMRAIEKNSDVKLLLVHKLDRMHRDTENQLHDLKKLDQLGVRLIATADGIDTAEASTNLIAVIKAAIAEQYSVNLSAETRKGLTEAAKIGLHCGGKPPYGFRLNQDKYLEIDETTAPAVKQIFKMYLADMGYTAILDWLEQHGYRTAKGNPFSKGSIYSILHNEKYAGVYVYDKAASKDENGRRNSHKYKDSYIRVEGGCPALITPEEFAAAQKKLKDRSDAKQNYSTKHYYPLNGKVWNADGSVRYSGCVNHSNGKKYYQYRCVESGSPSVNADGLEEAVFFAMRTVLLSDDKRDRLLERLHSYAEDIHEQTGYECSVLKNKKVALENSLGHLLASIESGKAPKSVMNRISELENEICQLDGKIQAIETEPHIFTESDMRAIQREFIPYMKSCNTLEAKELLNRTLDSVRIGRDMVEIKFKNGIEVNKETMDFFRN